jgi:hypothetical protein
MNLIFFSALCPKAFSEMFKYSKQAGIYWVYSILYNKSYIGSTTDFTPARATKVAARGKTKPARPAQLASSDFLIIKDSL